MALLKNVSVSLAFLSVAFVSAQAEEKFTDLFDTSLSKWEKFIGVPHSTVKVDGHESNDNMNEGTPLGLNNDPLNVFSVIEEEGETVVFATGEIYGGLTTLKEFENYHFSVEVKWGEKKYEPRLKAKRDAGLLYHCVGEHGAFWNVWMQCLEYQIQEGDFGDFFNLAGTGGYIKGSIAAKGQIQYSHDGELLSTQEKGAWRGIRSMDHEKPHGEWNLVEIYVLGDRAIHLANGHKVFEIQDATCRLNGENKSLTKGKIQLQAEGAEVYYRRAQIRPISAFPEELTDATLTK